MERLSSAPPRRASTERCRPSTRNGGCATMSSYCKSLDPSVRSGLGNVAVRQPVALQASAQRLFGNSAIGIPLRLRCDLSLDVDRAEPGPAKIAKKTKRYPSDMTGGCCRSISAVADGLWLVPRAGAALPVPDHPRRGADARSRAGRARGEPNGRRDRQPVGQGSAGRNKGLRRRQEDRRPQAPHRGRYRRAAVDGQPDRRRHLRQRRRAGDPRRRSASAGPG